MKVSSDKNLEQTQALAKSKQAQKKSTAGTVSASPMKAEGQIGAANVKLSERAQDMKKIREAVNNTPDVDEAKIAKFRAMIAKGEYKPDARKVADKMVDEFAYQGLMEEEK